MSQAPDAPAPCMTIEQARAMIAGLVEAFHAKDVERLANGWREDIVIRFADHPEIRGKAAGKQWLAARFARQKDYKLVKSFQALTGDIIGDMWTGQWTDAQTGRAMRGKGMEFLTMIDGKIALWEGVFNAWPEGEAGAVPIT